VAAVTVTPAPVAKPAAVKPPKAGKKKKGQVAPAL
jgi:hypothetical protein